MIAARSILGHIAGTMAGSRKSRLFFALPLLVSALPFVACSSSSEGGSTAVDAAIDYGPGPTTGRPDDGPPPDTNVAPDTFVADTHVTKDDGVETSATDTATTETAAETSGDIGFTSPSQARIHEVLVDRNLEGDKIEFIEISAPAGVALDALRLRVLDSTGKQVLDVAVADTGTKAPSSGLWVVGGPAATTDKSYSIAMWGIPNDVAAIQLTRNDGIVQELLDVVAYGGTPTAPTAEPKKVVEGSPATLPASGSTNKSIGRKSVPGDTDDNKTDFCVQTATPKAPNGPCL